MILCIGNIKEHNNAINTEPKSYAALRFLAPVMAGVGQRRKRLS
jgi:hypothetical protein